jgi:hypothetical protein
MPIPEGVLARGFDHTKLVVGHVLVMQQLISSVQPGQRGRR